MEASKAGIPSCKERQKAVMLNHKGHEGMNHKGHKAIRVKFQPQPKKTIELLF